MNKLKTGDNVIVIAGKDKGKTGEIQKVVDKGREGLKVIVSGVNRVKKHQKPNPQLGRQGGIVEKEALINASNVAIVNPQTGKRDRVGFKFEDNKKVRFYKSTNTTIAEG